MGTSGGPITQDNTSIEYYCTIFTLMESPVDQGRDLDRLRRRAGARHARRRQEVGQRHAAKDMPEWIRINSIDASPHDAGTAYVAATMYKSDDFRPYLYKTTDYGKTWKKIVNGIPANAFTRVIREDPNHKGLLVAGTEIGLYHLLRRRRELAVVPAEPAGHADHRHRRSTSARRNWWSATEGRAFWVLDDVPLLYQLNGGAATEDAQLFQPKDTVPLRRRRARGWRRRRRRPRRRESAGRRGGLLLAEGPRRRATSRWSFWTPRARWSTNSPASAKSRVRRPARGRRRGSVPRRSAGARCRRRRA